MIIVEVTHNVYLRVSRNLLTVDGSEILFTNYMWHFVPYFMFDC